MKAINIHEPAFPTDCEWRDGMTLRDYFAAHALAGVAVMLANSPVEVRETLAKKEGLKTWPELPARIAYAWADAMLAERAKTF